VDPGSEQSFFFEFGDSRVDCWSGNVCLVSYELEVSEAVFPHRRNNLDVPRV